MQHYVTPSRQKQRRAGVSRAFSFSPVILAATGIQGPDYAPTRSWQQIFGGWTAASHPAHFLRHNLHYTQQGLWIPVATRMTGWGSRILTAARIRADNEKTPQREQLFTLGESNWWIPVCQPPVRAPATKVRLQFSPFRSSDPTKSKQLTFHSKSLLLEDGLALPIRSSAGNE